MGGGEVRCAAFQKISPKHDQKSNWKRNFIPNTRDPVWYKTQVFSNLLLPPRQYMPRIAITVMDHDKITSDDKIGHIWFSPCDDRMIVDKAPTAMLPKPEWYPLLFEDGTEQIALKIAQAWTCAIALWV